MAQRHETTTEQSRQSGSSSACRYLDRHHVSSEYSRLLTVEEMQNGHSTQWAEHCRS